ncbi:MAG TPA: CDP-alcohol phosphatidyltransferase family protein [Gaiellaceae bacterium]|nr:CDP-alcohol phosphatidyltransferase family protein [Gaiellaceae bacterium]
MTASTEDATGASATPHARRAGRELVLEVVFRPLSSVLVPILARLRMSPPTVVLANAAVGLLAVLVLARGELAWAAVLLQVKTLLDNCDGQLARATGRVTLTGRYLDTIADLVVNACLFMALAVVTGEPLLALAAFVALTLILAADFNVTELYREANGRPTPQPVATGSRAERILASIYSVVFAPLDRLTRGLASRRFDGRGGYDSFTVTALANLGLSTQLLVLGVCLVLDAPRVYLWLVLACLAALVPLQFRAERRAGQTAPRSVSR